MNNAIFRIRWRLFKLLSQQSGIESLIGMTMNAADKVPNLGAKRVGASFWMEAGRLLPI